MPSARAQYPCRAPIRTRFGKPCIRPCFFDTEAFMCKIISRLGSVCWLVDCYIHPVTFIHASVHLYLRSSNPPSIRPSVRWSVRLELEITECLKLIYSIRRFIQYHIQLRLGLIEGKGASLGPCIRSCLFLSFLRIEGSLSEIYSRSRLDLR